jgi:holo-[acyl-carrier protein] synthase
MTAPTLRVGIDLTSVFEVAASVERFGDHYVKRIFTPHEIECCQVRSDSCESGAGYSYESLAARFAAKEAVVKVLQPVGARPAWRDIEVRRVTGGRPEIRLSGRAAAMADRVGIADLAVSMTHEQSAAAAIVVGLCGNGQETSDIDGAEDDHPVDFQGEQE